MKRGRRKKQMIPPREIREAFELYLDRINQKEISRRLKISQMTISRWAKRYGWREKRDSFMKDFSEAIVDDKIRKWKKEFSKEFGF